jgi:hypothetical protein
MVHHYKVVRVAKASTRTLPVRQSNEVVEVAAVLRELLEQAVLLEAGQVVLPLIQEPLVHHLLEAVEALEVMVLIMEVQAAQVSSSFVSQTVLPHSSQVV